MHCGEGRDRVLADQFDQVDNDCERVIRRDITSLDQVDDGEENRTENPAPNYDGHGRRARRGGAVPSPRRAPPTLLQDVRVAPSILASDFARLGEQVEEVMDAGARVIHVDVMDGHFVPPISIGPLIVDALRDLVHDRGGVLDVHLMVERPERRVEEFAAAGADSLIVHWEATPHVHYALQAVRAAGLDAGLALNPATPAEVVAGLTDELDHVLCMTVNPGWGGQPYIESSTAKVARLRELLGPDVPIEVDGGIDAATGRGHPRGRRHAVRGRLVDLRHGRPGGGLPRDRHGGRRGLGSRRDRPDQVHAARGRASRPTG